MLSQSGAFWRGNEGANGPPYEWLARRVATQPRRDVRFYLEVGGDETVHVVGVGPVFVEAHRRLRDALRARGYDVVDVEAAAATLLRMSRGEEGTLRAILHHSRTLRERTADNRRHVGVMAEKPRRIRSTLRRRDD